MQNNPLKYLMLQLTLQSTHKKIESFSPIAGGLPAAIFSLQFD